MYDEDVCPNCDSSNTETVEVWHDARGDAYTDMKCNDCGCEYRCQWIEVLGKIEVKGEDY